MKMKLFVAFLFLLTGSANYVLAAKKTIDLSSEESKVEFLAIGKPSLLKIRGTGGRLKGKLECENGLVSGNFFVPLEPVTTGIGLRDEHMKTKYLETAKYPDAELTISALKFPEDPFAKDVSAKEVPFTGKLKIHGSEKDISGTVDVNSGGGIVTMSARTKTTISAHNIALPSYMGIKVADDVEIFTDLKIKKQ